MIVTKTPLRLEFTGGSTDLANFYSKYPGRILNSTIDKYIYVTVREIGGWKSRILVNGVAEEYINLRQLKNPIVREALRMLKIDKKLEIVISSEVDPKGSGLGLSSSLSVGLINALSLLKGKRLNKRELAESACHLEIDLLKSPIGKQDQYAASFGGFSLYTFNKNGRVGVKPVSLKRKFLNELEKYLLTFHTGYSHSSSKILSKQNKYFEKNFENLKKMGGLSVEAVNLLNHENIKGFAKCLENEWTIKRSLFGITKNENIDMAYEKAIKHGAWGGRLSGAGGGGYLYVFAPTSKHKRIIDALKGYTAIPVKFTSNGSEAVSL